MNKLVGGYNNTYHRSIGKKVIDADYSVLTGKKNPKASKFNSVRIASKKILLAKITLKNGQKKYLWPILC